MVEAREADRKVLAGLLHDEATQTLANLALHLQICERAISVDVERGKAELQAARTALSEAIARLRAQIFELRPQILEDAGLVATLKRYVAARGSTDVEIVDSSGGRRFAPATELGMYRVIQAALAGAPGPVRVELADSTLTVTGTAGEPSDTMRDWAAALGAQLEVTADRVSLTVQG